MSRGVGRSGISVALFIEPNGNRLLVLLRFGRFALPQGAGHQI